MAMNDVYILKMNSNGDWEQYSLNAEAGKAIGFDSSLNPVMLPLGGLNNFIEARTITAPNTTIPVHSIKATGAETNIDFAIVPKGAGALTTQIADGTATGGNKRGNYAIDLQLYRSTAAQVASASYSIAIGNNCTALSDGAVAIGYSTTAGAYYAVAIGYNNRVQGFNGVAIGNSHLVQNGGTAIGGACYALASSSGCIGTGLNTYLDGQFVSGNNSAGTSKVRQDSKCTLQKTTTNATATELFANGSVRLVLKNNCSWAFDITILGHSSTNVLHSARFKRSGLIVRGASASATSLEGVIQTIGTDIINSNLSGCTVDILADTTNGALKVMVTGIASTNIIWQAKIELIEIEI